MRLLLFSLCLLLSAAAGAQSLNMPWVASSVADSASQVWFRKGYLFRGKPRQASLTVVTTGYFELYVNGRNVSTQVLTPRRAAFCRDALGVTYDVERFLSPDSNVVAVLYSPASPCATPYQVAVQFAGVDARGHAFCDASDASWLCRRAGRRVLPDGGEEAEGGWPLSYFTGNAIDQALWTPATVAHGAVEPSFRLLPASADGMRVARIIKPAFFDVVGDSVVYDFGTAFQGWVRVTLRDARVGEQVNVGGMVYVCTGQMDEQACRKFTLPVCRRVWIYGDTHFRKSQIQNVEGLVLEPAESGGMWPWTW